MVRHISKVLAYIVTSNHQLLVFRHPSVPEAGIQVLAGTVEVGEEPAVAVMRAAFEEIRVLLGAATRRRTSAVLIADHGRMLPELLAILSI